MRILFALIAACTLASCEREQAPEQTPTDTDASQTLRTETAAQAVRSTPSAAILAAREARDAGRLGEAAALFQALAATNQTEAWLGRAELAALRGQSSELRHLAGQLPKEWDDPKAREAAAVLLSGLDEPAASVVGFIDEACKNPSATPELSQACAIHQLRKTGPLTQCAAGCDSPQIVGLYPAGFPIAFAKINGSEPMPFGFFGVAPMMLDPETVRELGLETTEEASFTIVSSGTPVPARYILADLDIGDMSFKRVPFVELSQPDKVVAGGIAPHLLFGDRTVEVDLAALELRVGTEPADSDVETSPLVRTGGWATWGSIGQRASGALALDIGSRRLSISESYDALGEPLPRAKEIPMICAGEVECLHWLVSPLKTFPRIGATELDYPSATIRPDDAIAYGFLQTQATLGLQAVAGRVVRFDPKQERFTVSKVARPPQLTIGDRAEFTVKGSAVKPGTIREKILKADGQHVEYEQVVDGRVFRIRVPESFGERGGWLLQRNIDGVFETSSDKPTQDVGLVEYRTALGSKAAPRHKRLDSLHVGTADWILGGKAQRCLELQNRAQIDEDRFGKVEVVQCIAAKWMGALFRLTTDEGEVLYEYRRSKATAVKGLVR